jgi:hypothetical protein
MSVRGEQAVRTGLGLVVLALVAADHAGKEERRVRRHVIERSFNTVEHAKIVRGHLDRIASTYTISRSQMRRRERSQKLSFSKPDVAC